MGIIVWYTDPRGRRCPTYKPDTLRQVELNLETFCQPDELLEDEEDESPDGATGDPMTTIRHDDVLVYADGREATGADAGRADARKQLEILTEQEVARETARTGRPREAVYAECYRRTCQVNRDLVRRSLGLGPSLDDARRRLGPSQGYAITDGVATYHVSGVVERRHGSLNRSDLLAPPPGVRIVWGPDFASMGQRPEQVVFDKAIFGHKGLCENWLGKVGLVAASWSESFAAFTAVIFHGDEPSPPRVQYAKPPEKPKDPEEAKRRLLRRATELSKVGPSEAMLMAILEDPEALEVLLAEHGT